MSNQHKYEMEIGLNVLNHLGINLYSNVSAVMSEVVANSWDADAEEVNITLEPKSKTITIKDNGHGMTLEDINSRFLFIGFKKREADDKSGQSPRFKRNYMGRKGIGKLSLFSIANKILIETIKNGEKNAFLMETQEIEKQIKNTKNNTYHPKEASTENIDFEHGTRITLTELKKNIYNTDKSLKKRLARRFSILGEKYNFTINVNEEEVKISDRDYFHKFEYVWTYDEAMLEKYFKDKQIEYTEARDHTITVDGKQYKIKGWIATVKESGSLKDFFEDTNKNESLNKIVIMVRGKMAQENILDYFSEGGLYSKYIIGELEADFLDINDKEDIATSSRQSIVEDDKRYEALQAFIQKELKHIQGKWQELRDNEGTHEALEIPSIKTWFKTLPKEHKKEASKFFGKINRTPLSKEEKKNLFKHSVFAFESLRYKKDLDMLDNIDETNIADFVKIFTNLNDMEASLYYQIVKERLRVIEKFQEKVDNNALEKVLQELLFKNLWLLDPSWERATGTEYMEQRVETEFKKIDAKLPKDDKAEIDKNRIDIKYAKETGGHVIIELKRADITTDDYKLIGQVDRYIVKLKDILSEINASHEPVEAICLIGKPLRQWNTPENRQISERTLKEKSIRVLLYPELLNNAHKAYKDFMDKRREKDNLTKLLEEIDLATTNQNNS